MAAWCLATGQAPAVWCELTVRQRTAFIDLLREARRRG